MNSDLFIWVEGPDDLTFFETVLKPIFELRYEAVWVRPYAEMKKKKCSSFLKVIKKMNEHYLCVTDIDSAPCVTERKRRLRAQNFGSLLDEDRVAVVVREIEGWYLAGLDKANCNTLGIRFAGDTNSISKEDFDRLIPRRYDSKKDFLAEVLKCFNMTIAKQKSLSFKYFIDKHCS